MTRVLPVYLGFLMDCTGSMQPWIDDAKNQIDIIITETQREYPDTDIHVGFVGYRDYGDAEPLIVMSFTRDIASIRDRIGAIRAEGGDDVAEDVAGGLESMRTMMRGIPGDSVSQIIHIADAPPHGMAFHSPFVTDRFPGGDPNGTHPLECIVSISNMDVDYTFVKINETTDTMIEQFHNSWQSDEGFRVVDLRPSQVALPPSPPILRASLAPMVPGGEPMMSPLGRALTATISQSIRHHTASQDS